MGVFNAIATGSLLPWTWFRRNNRETDYETILSGLAREIASVQSRLTQIRTRERRASVTLTLQAFLIWALYTGTCWYLNLFYSFSLLEHDGDLITRLLVVWLPVFGSPVLIIFTRKIVRWWYRRVGAAEEKHLIDLKRQQREKIDEIKRATKYDNLRMLLEKYDDSKPKPAAPAPSAKRAPAVDPAQRMAMMRQQAPGAPLPPGATPRPLPPAAPMQRTWMDKVADAVLGADPIAAGPEQKYALICAKCHAHNGLSLKQEFEEIQYTCPRCGMFNSRRQSTAPQSSPFSPRVASQPTSQKQEPAEEDEDAPPPAKPLGDDSDGEAPSTTIDTPTKPSTVRARRLAAESMDLDD